VIETGIPNSFLAAIENLEVRQSPDSQRDALDAEVLEVTVSPRIPDQENVPEIEGQQTTQQ
jgi:hypothetical protein